MNIRREVHRLWQLGAIEAGAPLMAAPTGQYWLEPVLNRGVLVWDMVDDGSAKGPFVHRWMAEWLDAIGERPISIAPGPQWTGDDLVRFASLHRRDDTEILAFAKQWGWLAVCGHDLPCDHAVVEGRRLACRTWMDGSAVMEDVGQWRSFSRQAEALLTIAAALGQDPPQCGKREDWIAVRPRSVPLFPEEVAAEMNREAERLGLPFLRTTPVAVAKGLISKTVGELLSFDRVTLALDWRGSTPGMRLVSGEFGDALSLLGMIAVSLLTTVARADRLAMCSGCGKPFLVKRRGGSGKRRFCDDCGRPEAVRQASSDYSARKRAKQQAAKPEGQP